MIVFIALLCCLIAALELRMARRSKMTEKDLFDQVTALRASFDRVHTDIHILREGKNEVNATLGGFRNELNRSNARTEQLDHRLDELSKRLSGESKRRQNSVNSLLEQYVRPMLTPTAKRFAAEEKHLPDETAKEAPISGGAYGTDIAKMANILAEFRSTLDALNIGVRFAMPPETGSWYVRFYLTTGTEQDFTQLQQRVDRAVATMSDEATDDEVTRRLRKLAALLSEEDYGAINAGPLVMLKSRARFLCQTLTFQQLHEFDVPQLIREPAAAIEPLLAAGPQRVLDLAPLVSDITHPFEPVEQPDTVSDLLRDLTDRPDVRDEPARRPFGDDGPISPF